MKRLTKIASVPLIAFALLAADAGATGGKCKKSGNGVYNCFTLWARASDIPSIAAGYGLTVVEELNAQTPDVVLVEGPSVVPPETTQELVKADPGVLGFELLTLASVTEAVLGSLADGTTVVIDALTLTGTYSGPNSGYYSTPVWEGYLNQPAASVVRLPETHALSHSEAKGLGVVAVIDTGVDPSHPILQGALVSGYDFLLDVAGVPSEWDALDPATRTATETSLKDAADQSFATILEGDGTTSFAAESIAGIVDQSFATILESQSLPTAFGHGTMVAGVVRMVAPAAKIMPIRVFDDDGAASMFDIVKAIYWAVDNGANVINMSFSTTQGSEELAKAVKYAKARGVVCVSSAGNTGNQALTYPAAYGEVLGVASTDRVDNRSTFTSYGDSLVSLAAPGEEIVTLYPGGNYAAGWGTSFSAAFISGATVLLNRDLVGPADLHVKFRDADGAYEQSSAPAAAAGEVGYGRLDVYAAFGDGLHGY